MLIYLAEITYYDRVAASLKVLRLCTGDQGYVTDSTDTPPDTYYEPSIKAPFNFQQQVLNDGLTGGVAQGGYGVCEIINFGAYDYLADVYNYGFDGRLVRFLVGENDAPYSSFTVLFTGRMAQPEFTEDRFVLRLRDRVEDMRKATQANTYLGNNVNPNGIEGTADDLKGKAKPLLYGRCLNIEPAWVNQQKMIFQAHDGKVDAFEAVYSNGDALTFSGNNYSDNAALQAATVTAGQFATCLNEGLFKLGASTATVITADVRGDASLTGYVYKPTDIIKRILMRHAGFILDDFDTTFTTMATTCPYESGIYLETGDTSRIDAVLNEFMSGFGIWLTFSRSGVASVGRLFKPTGLETPVAYLTELEIIEANTKRLVPFDKGDGTPPYRVWIDYQKNWRKHTKTEITGNVYTNNAARAAWLGAEWRTGKAEDGSMQTLHPLAPSFEYSAYMNSAADVGVEAARILALYANKLDRMQINMRPKYSTGLKVGDVVNITLPRYSFTGGRNAVIIGLVENRTDDISTLEVIA